MKRLLAIITASLALPFAALAQTPVESLISSYDDSKGVKVFVAKGATMSIARGYIKKSPLRPLAENVEAVTIMMMKNASGETKTPFLHALRKSLKAYQFYGRKPGMDGRVVEVYGSPIKNGVVAELVIFNPEQYSLFSLRGSYPVEELQELDK